jgi:hypothetical protein
MIDETLQYSTHQILEQIVENTCLGWAHDNSPNSLVFAIWGFYTAIFLYNISRISPRLFEWLMRARMYKGN